MNESGTAPSRQRANPHGRETGEHLHRARRTLQAGRLRPRAGPLQGERGGLQLAGHDRRRLQVHGERDPRGKVHEGVRRLLARGDHTGAGHRPRPAQRGPAVALAARGGTRPDALPEPQPRPPQDAQADDGARPRAPADGPAAPAAPARPVGRQRAQEPTQDGRTGE